MAAISEASRPEQKGSLFDDLSPLQAILPQQVPEAFELTIYDQFAMVTAPYADSKNGRGRFTYKGGAVTGPQDATGVQSCAKKIALSSVDFSLVPRLVKQAPGLLGAPSGKVTHVSLSGGVFCQSDRLVRLRGEGGFRRVQARWPGRQDPKDVTRLDRFGL